MELSMELWGYSSVRLERTPDKGEVAGSTPASPTTFKPFSAIRVGWL